MNFKVVQPLCVQQKNVNKKHNILRQLNKKNYLSNNYNGENKME